MTTYSQQSSAMPEISSFIFFDIETTGLPWQERNQTKIVEFSFVAAHRKQIQNTSFGDTPPVSKLTFVLNPLKEIHREVTLMTGLSNDLLSHAPTFSQKIKSVTSFLEDLPKPSCLVAHNGNNFDFKILLAELNDASASLPIDLLCVDSLVGFRNLLKGTNINHLSLAMASAVTQIPTSTCDDLLTDDEDEWPDLNVSTEEWNEIDDICLSLSDISHEDLSESEETSTPKNIQQVRSKAIKNVFNKKPNSKVTSKSKKPEKQCYTLSALYKRLLNKEEANAHRAEVDCMMLVQCVVALKEEFVPWADTACKKLTDINALIRY